MESLPRFVIVAVLAILFGQSCCFGTDVRNEILKAYDKVKDSFTGSGARILEDVILDKIISAIKNGSDCFGNPPLDPLNYEDNIHLENITILDYILLDFVDLNGVHSTGLSEFLVHTFTFNLEGLEVVLNITFPELNLEIDHYNISGVALNVIPYVGDGIIQLTTRNVNVALSFSLGSTEDGNILLETLSAYLAVGEIKFRVTGFMGGSRTSYLAGEVVSAVGPKAIEQLQASYGPQIVQTLQELINNLLASGGESASDIITCFLL